MVAIIDRNIRSFLQTVLFSSLLISIMSLVNGLYVMNTDVDLQIIGLSFFIAGLLSVILMFSLRLRGVIVFTIFAFAFSLFWLFVFYYYLDYKTGIPFEFFPKDSLEYHYLGKKLSKLSFKSSLDYLENNGYRLPDFGFPIYLKYIYSLFGSNLLFIRLTNVFFHVGSCYYLYRLFYLFKINERISYFMCLLYAVNPLSLYVSITGLKEQLFLFIIVCAIYHFNKWYVNSKTLHLICAFLLTIVTMFFRLPITAVLFFQLGVYMFIKIKALSLFKKLPLYLFFTLVGIYISIFIIGIMTSELDVYSSFSYMDMLKYRMSVSSGGGSSVPVALTTSIIGGLIGPFPSFVIIGDRFNEVIMAGGLFIKGLLSIYMFGGIYAILKYKDRDLYPLLSFIVFSTVIIIVTLYSFDPRFHYVFFPFLFLFAAIGFENLKKKNYIYMYSGVYLLLIGLWNFLR